MCIYIYALCKLYVQLSFSFRYFANIFHKSVCRFSLQLNYAYTATCEQPNAECTYEPPTIKRKEWIKKKKKNQRHIHRQECGKHEIQRMHVRAWARDQFTLVVCILHFVLPSLASLYFIFLFLIHPVLSRCYNTRFGRCCIAVCASTKSYFFSLFFSFLLVSFIFIRYFSFFGYHNHSSPNRHLVCDLLWRGSLRYFFFKSVCVVFKIRFIVPMLRF